jgi:hypothetical protein
MYLVVSFSVCIWCNRSVHYIGTNTKCCCWISTLKEVLTFLVQSDKEEDVKPNMEGLGTSEEMMSQPRVTEVEIVEDVVITSAKAADDDAARENESEFSHTAEESGEAPIIPKKRMVMYKFYFLLQQQAVGCPGGY